MKADKRFGEQRIGWVGWLHFRRIVKIATKQALALDTFEILSLHPNCGVRDDAAFMPRTGSFYTMLDGRPAIVTPNGFRGAQRVYAVYRVEFADYGEHLTAADQPLAQDQDAMTDIITKKIASKMAQCQDLLSALTQFRSAEMDT